MLDAYEQDNKAAITYHMNFVYEQKILAVRQSAISDEDKVKEVGLLELERDKEIAATFEKIEAKRLTMQQTAISNVLATKKVTEAVYNYFSTTPITIDSVDFWIEKIIVISNDKRN